jgi:hypothetical protein
MRDKAQADGMLGARLSDELRSRGTQLVASPYRVTARFTSITPNKCHDMHDCPVSSGDDWLKAFIPKPTISPVLGLPFIGGVATAPTMRSDFDLG